MLYPTQKKLANTIGILIGIAAIGILLAGHLPSSNGQPTIGAAINVNAWVGGSIQPSPRQPKNFIKAANLTAGGSPASGVVTFRSENGQPEQISIGVSEQTKNLYASEDYAREITLDFGEAGSLGSSTLAQLAEHPLAPFTMTPGQVKKIPVAVAIPLGAGNQVAGKQIEITLTPEHAK